jgi:DNA-binding transcriptional LysR family regulator
VLGSWKVSLAVASATRALLRAEGLSDLEGAAILRVSHRARMTRHIDQCFTNHNHFPQNVVRCDRADALRAMLRKRRSYSVLLGRICGGGEM